MSAPQPHSAIVDCKHYANGKRVWCPPMCPCQSNPDPITPQARRAWSKAHENDRTVVAEPLPRDGFVARLVKRHR